MDELDSVIVAEMQNEGAKDDLLFEVAPAHAFFSSVLVIFWMAKKGVCFKRGVSINNNPGSALQHFIFISFQTAIPV